MRLETIYETEQSDRQESLCQTERDTDDDSPRDKCYLVYFIGVILGFVQVLPWNVLSMAADKYFSSFKFNTTELRDNGFEGSFTRLITMICLTTHFLFSTINTIAQSRPRADSNKSLNLHASTSSPNLKSKHRRILIAISVMLVTLILHAVFAMIDTSSWSVTFYWITVVSAVILMAASGLYQSNTFGLFAHLPVTYTNALVLGNYACGSLIAAITLCSELFELCGANSRKVYAVYLVTFSIVVLLVAFNCYCLLPNLAFFQYFTSVADQRRQLASIERVVDDLEQDDAEEQVEKSLIAFANRTGFSVTDSSIVSRSVSQYCLNNGKVKPFTSTIRGTENASAQCSARWPPYRRMFIAAWPHFLAIWNCFFCTLSLYPSVLSRVQRSDPAFFVPAGLYSTVICFLFFNVFSLIGGVMAQFVFIPGPRWLWLAVLVRTVISVPFFVLCNYLPTAGAARRFPVLIDNDWVFLVAIVLLAFTNGHFSGLAMMYAPHQFEEQLRGWAGTMSAFFLALGLVSGAAFSLAIVAAIEQPSTGALFPNYTVNSTAPTLGFGFVDAF